MHLRRELAERLLGLEGMDVYVVQAVMLGLMGIVPGLLASVAMAYVMFRATLPVIGHPVPFSWHPWLSAGNFAAALRYE